MPFMSPLADVALLFGVRAKTLPCRWLSREGAANSVLCSMKCERRPSTAPIETLYEQASIPRDQCQSPGAALERRLGRCLPGAYDEPAEICSPELPLASSNQDWARLSNTTIRVYPHVWHKIRVSVSKKLSPHVNLTYSIFSSLYCLSSFDNETQRNAVSELRLLSH